MKEEVQEQYTILEASDYLGISRGSTKEIYTAIHAGELQASKAYKNKWLIDGQSLARYKAQLNNRFPAPIQRTSTSLPVGQDFHVQEEAMVSPKQERDDSQLFPRVVSSVFSFLAEHHLVKNIQAIQEVIEPLRLWEVVAGDTALQAIVAGEHVTVLADDYQRMLEAQVQDLRNQLREAQTTLTYLRQKPQERILHEYARPLPVMIEARSDGFLVWSSMFPFAARGNTEEEALAAFRRVLHGYCWQLRTHEKELKNGMREQFVALRDLLLEP